MRCGSRSGRWRRGRPRRGLDFPSPTPVSSGAQNAQAAIERNLENLNVREPRAEAAPVYSQIGAGINAVICSDIKRARRGGVVDLNGPDRQIGKRAAACAADVRPVRAAVRSSEDMAPVWFPDIIRMYKAVDHCVRDLGVSGIDLNLIDSTAAPRQIAQRPHRPVVDGNKDLADRGGRSPSGGIDRVRV